VKKQGQQEEQSKRDPELRDRAEGQLARAPGAAVIDKKPAAAIIHELQVHQIELEMQNEELRKMQLILEESRSKYLDLYDFAPVGYFTLTDKSLIAEVNLTGAGLLGVARQKLMNGRFRRFVAPGDQGLWDLHLLSVLKGEEKRTCDLLLRRKDGSTFPAHLESIRLEVNSSTPVVRTMVSDVTERKHIEEALETAHDKLEQHVEERTIELRTALSQINILKEQCETENIYFRHENKMKHRFENIIGQSDGLKYVLYRAEQVAPANTTVLILGETGTGKELIAAAIHNMSPRKERPLITVNCAALPCNLIESELFGREKGAFTGADTRQVGRFEVAHGSTLCLDEIGELPLEVQAKLLRVIQHNEFERLGSSHTIKVDVRIVATTNRDLEEEIRKGRFRQDLYYRLNVFPITVPPLRQRREDIPLMVQSFVERYARKLGKQITSIPKETMKTLQDYPWPGNVRELESIIERAAILCPGPVLQLTDKLEIPSPSLSATVRTLEETERNQIVKILSETGWRIEGNDGAAAILGLHPSTLRARMHKLGIARSEPKDPS